MDDVEEIEMSSMLWKLPETFQTFSKNDSHFQCFIISQPSFPSLNSNLLIPQILPLPASSPVFSSDLNHGVKDLLVVSASLILSPSFFFSLSPKKWPPGQFMQTRNY
ncbi:unnamed protein product [Caenorhabditis nigoni]